MSRQKEHYLRLFTNKSALSIAERIIADLQGYYIDSAHRDDDEERLAVAVEVLMQLAETPAAVVAPEPDESFTEAELDRVVQAMKDAEEHGQYRTDGYYRHLANMIAACVNAIHEVVGERLTAERAKHDLG